MTSILDLADDLSDSENDDDYVPSEEEISDQSADENTDDEVPPDEELTLKRKRKRGKKSAPKVNSESQGIVETQNGEKKDVLTEEAEKKRAESLWEDFLQDVTPPVRKKGSICSELGSKELSSNSCGKSDSVPKKVTVSEVFEFAGEAVVVTKEVDQNSKETGGDEKIVSTSTDTKPVAENASKNAQSTAVKRPGGLGSVLGTIMNKKQKLSTLQKSMLDWKSFKKEEGLEEELDQHRRSKDSYVEKQAFLQRSDVRQFEIEKSIRQTSRSNR